MAFDLHQESGRKRTLAEAALGEEVSINGNGHGPSKGRGAAATAPPRKRTRRPPSQPLPLVTRSSSRRESTAVASPAIDRPLQVDRVDSTGDDSSSEPGTPANEIPLVSDRGHNLDLEEAQFEEKSSQGGYFPARPLRLGRPPKRRRPGRRKILDPDRPTAAAMQRQSHLASHYRAVCKALKPCLAEWSTRTLRNLADDPTAHTQTEDHARVLAELDDRLRQNITHIQKEHRLRGNLLVTKREGDREMIRDTFARTVEDLQDDFMVRARDQVMEIERSVRQQADQDATDDEAEQNTRRLSTSQGDRGEEVVSRSALFLQTDQRWKQFLTRTKVSRVLRSLQDPVELGPRMAPTVRPVGGRAVDRQGSADDIGHPALDTLIQAAVAGGVSSSPTGPSTAQPHGDDGLQALAVAAAAAAAAATATTEVLPREGSILSALPSIPRTAPSLTALAPPLPELSMARMDDPSEGPRELVGGSSRPSTGRSWAPNRVQRRLAPKPQPAEAPKRRWRGRKQARVSSSKMEGSKALGDFPRIEPRPTEAYWPNPTRGEDARGRSLAVDQRPFDQNLPPLLPARPMNRPVTPPSHLPRPRRPPPGSPSMGSACQYRPVSHFRSEPGLSTSPGRHHPLSDPFSDVGEVGSRPPPQVTGSSSRLHPANQPPSSPRDIPAPPARPSVLPGPPPQSPESPRRRRDARKFSEPYGVGPGAVDRSISEDGGYQLPAKPDPPVLGSKVWHPRHLPDPRVGSISHNMSPLAGSPYPPSSTSLYSAEHYRPPNLLSPPGALQPHTPTRVRPILSTENGLTEVRPLALPFGADEVLDPLDQALHAADRLSQIMATTQSPSRAITFAHYRQHPGHITPTRRKSRAERYELDEYVMDGASERGSL